MQRRHIWIDYLRSAITVLVVAHHASLAYTTFARFDSQTYINSTHAIVDKHRWIGLDIFENFNDIFFMSLMFFIGGLFLTKSISKKGMILFIKDRFYRLFLPFILGGTLLMLIAYLPSWYISQGNLNIIAYIIDFFGTEQWPVGPPWFIWVLFAFNLLFALFYPLLRSVYAKYCVSIISNQIRPVTFSVLAVVFTWILYVPLTYQVGASTWTGIGPFDFQLGRILLYFGYFMSGVMIGNTDFNEEIFSKNALLVKNWKLWILLALLIYAALTASNVFHLLEGWVKSGHMNEFTAWMIYYLLYTSSCVLSSIAFVTAFRSNIKKPIGWVDSLSENAYLIYLVHFVFITSTQFLLLNLNILAPIKFIIVFLSSLFLSWGLSILLRKIPFLKRYL